jgi:hypothetical protein
MAGRVQAPCDREPDETVAAEDQDAQSLPFARGRLQRIMPSALGRNSVSQGQ